MRFLLLVLFAMTTLLAEPTTSYEEKLTSYLSAKFTKLYPKISINNIVVKRYSPLPREFEKYKLSYINITDSSLKREKGSVSAVFKYGRKKRKLYYHFNIDATVEVLKANQYIQKGKTISDDLVDFVPIKLTNFYQTPITEWYLNKYRARTTLVEGKILTTRHVVKVTDVKRGDMLTTTLRDGGVSVTFQTKALKDAYIGDTIKVKRNHQNFFHVRVTSATTAEVTQ